MRRHGWRPITSLGTAALGLVLAAAGQADDRKPTEDVVPQSPGQNLAHALAATSSTRRPLNLLLTQAELQVIVRNYEIKTGEILTAPIDEDEVVVTASYALLPMRDPSQDVPGGLAAPFWAIANPRNAWRIFLPIPPRVDRE